MDSSIKSKNRILLESMTNLYNEIVNAKDEQKATSCDGWIKIYNDILRRFRRDNQSNPEAIKFLKDFRMIGLSFSRIDRPEKWSDGINKTNRLKHKLRELISYFSHATHEKNEVQFDLKDIIKNKGLLNACKTCLDNGDSWDACSHACRHLEVKIRENAGLSANSYGVDLANEAFKVEGGKLKIPSCATISEEKGFHLILLGIMQFHRNAKGHREGILDDNCAIKIILYIDYLLEIINTAIPRNNSEIN